MAAMGPEAALLSARLAEIRASAGLDLPICVEAAAAARRSPIPAIGFPSRAPGFWARLHGRVAGGSRALAEGRATGVPGAAIPVLRMDAGVTARPGPCAPLALLPACQPPRR